MEENRLTIFKDSNGNGKLYLNGNEINRVLDFSYEKSSAANTTELTIKLDVNELEERFI